MRLLVVLVILMFLLAIPVGIMSTTLGESEPNFEYFDNIEKNDWPTFHHDRLRTGSTPSEAPETNHVLWVKKTGEDFRQSCPIIVDNKLYIGSDKQMYCLNATTGEVIWNRSIGGRVTCTPTYHNDRLFVASGNFRLYCLNASNGDTLWTCYAYSIITSSPAVAYNLVFFGTENRMVECLYETSGNGAWEFRAGSAVRSSPAIADGKVYINSLTTYYGLEMHPYTTYCLDAITGKQIWGKDTGDSLSSSPAVVGGKLYTGSLFGVVCYDALTGKHIWTHPSPAPYSSPCVVDGKVYIGTHGESGKWPYEARLDCLDAASGESVWSYNFGSTKAHYASPVVAGGKVYMGYAADCYPAPNPTIRCFNALTGEVIWSYSEPFGLFSSFAVSDGVLYFGTQGGLYAIGPDVYPPELTTSISSGAEIKSHDFTLNWSGSDFHSGIDHYEVRLDQGDWIDVGNSTNYTFTALEDGNYLITILAEDNANQSSTMEIAITVDTSIFGGPGWEDDTIFLTGLIVLLFIAVFVFYSLRTEGKE